jgi:hypothetical protein
MLGINVNGPTAVWEADYRWKDQSWVMAITQNESTGKFFAFKARFHYNDFLETSSRQARN